MNILLLLQHNCYACNDLAAYC